MIVPEVWEVGPCGIEALPEFWSGSLGHTTTHVPDHMLGYSELIFMVGGGAMHIANICLYLDASSHGAILALLTTNNLNILLLSIGPSTKLLHSLYSKISQYTELTNHTMRFNAFIFGLLK